MPVYVLRPVGPIVSEADWSAASIYQGFCRVHAASEDRAREYAAEFFGESTPASRLSEGDDHWSPWLDPASTECIHAGDPPPDEYLDGQIEVTVDDGPSGNDPIAVDVYKDGLGRKWRVVKEDRPSQMAPPDATAEADNTVIARHAAERDEARSATAAMSGSVLPPPQVHGKGPGVDQGGRGEMTLQPLQLNAESPGVSGRSVDLGTNIEAGAVLGVGAEVIRNPEITQQIVARTIQNRAVLQYQASTLAEFLNDLVGPDGVAPEQRNMSLGSALGISEALTEGQLLEILKSLRDELRRFNDALQQQTADPDALERLQDVGWKALNTFAQTVALGSGAIVLVSIGNFLDQAGLVPWARTIEGIEALKPGG